MVILVLAFALIRFLPMAFSSFASVGKVITSPFSGNDIDVSVNDSNINNGENFIVYWDYKPTRDGKYTVSFKCLDNLKLSIIADDSAKNFLCNTNYSIADESDNSIELKAIFTKNNSFVDLPILVSYVSDDNNIEAKGEVVVTVKNTSSPVGTNSGEATIISEPVDGGSDDVSDSGSSTSGNSSDTGSTGRGNIFLPRPVYSGNADLAITNVYAINNLAVRFDVSNIGGRSTGNWNFSYTPPHEDTELSPLQVSLAPGQTLRFTLTFDSANRGDLVVLADPHNMVSENSESNNAATIFINGGGDNNDYDDDYDPDDEADLEIENLEVGRMSGSRFVEDDEIDEDDDAAVRFTVFNRGGESTGSWRFEIQNLPYDDDDDFRSSRQDSLRPGESVTITVELENPDEGNYNIRVEVDSDDDVDEEDERNNDDSERLKVRN